MKKEGISLLVKKEIQKLEKKFLKNFSRYSKIKGLKHKLFFYII